MTVVPDEIRPCPDRTELRRQVYVLLLPHLDRARPYADEAGQKTIDEIKQQLKQLVREAGWLKS